MNQIDWMSLREQLAATEARLAETSSRAPEHWQGLLARRAHQLLQRKPALQRETHDYLLVALGNEQILLPIEILKSVERFESCESLPLSPPELLGISHQLGRMVSIVELATLLGIALSEEAASNGYILFVRTQPELGLRVTRLIEVVALAADTLIPAEAEGYFVGYGPEGRPILDLRMLLLHPFLASTHFSKELTL